MKRDDTLVVERDTPQDYVSREPEHIGPAHAELHSIATDAVPAEPGLHYRRATANILESKPGLRARVQQEHMYHALDNADGQQGNGTMGKIDCEDGANQ